MEEKEGQKQIPYDQQILNVALNISEEGGKERLTDLIWEANKKLLPAEDLNIGSYRSKDQFLNDYASEFRKLEDRTKDMVDVTIALADGHHRLIISIDREGLEYSKVSLSHSSGLASFDIQKRWEELINVPK